MCDELGDQAASLKGTLTQIEAQLSKVTRERTEFKEKYEKIGQTFDELKRAYEALMSDSGLNAKELKKTFEDQIEKLKIDHKFQLSISSKQIDELESKCKNTQEQLKQSLEEMSVK